MEDNKDAQIKENLSKIKHRIMVMSGKGGVGKSFIAVSLAYGLALSGKKVAILDADIHGPSIAKLMGIEGVPLGFNEETGRPMPIEVLSNLYALSVASMLSSDDSALIWRGPMKMALIKQFFSDFDWEELDYLIVDLPPGTGDEALSIIQTLVEVDGTVIVTTPQDIALLDVRKSLDFAKKLNIPVLGIVENMKYFVCPGCGEKTNIFAGEQLQKLIFEQQIDLLAELELNPAIALASDKGRPFIYDYNKLPVAEELQKMVQKVIAKVEG